MADIFLHLIIRVIISSVQFSRSVVSHSLRPHESQHARPPCPSPSPGVHSDSHPSSLWCHPAIYAVYGVAQSRTRLKRLSSSSSIYSENTCGNNRFQIQDSDWLWGQSKEVQLKNIREASIGFAMFLFFQAGYACLGDITNIFYSNKPAVVSVS